VEISKFEIELVPKGARLGFIKEAGKDEEISEISKKGSDFNISIAGKPRTDYSYSDKKMEELPPPQILKSVEPVEYSSKSIKKVELISTISEFKPPEVKQCYQRIFEKYRYTLIDWDKLTSSTKIMAHKKNLDNITKSGLK
jgi:hypothetical protein